MINRLIEIRDEHLHEFKNDKSGSYISSETKLQAKIMEKEINKQKNKVLKELVDKKEDIKSTKEEKFGLMLKIQKENTQLISECSKIRTDLQDILRFVTLVFNITLYIYLYFTIIRSMILKKNSSS